MTTKNKATAGKFNDYDESEVRISGRVVGTLTRDYVTATTGAECIGDYGFDPRPSTHEDSDLWGIMHRTAMSWKGHRVQSAASARRKILEAVTAAA